jgi:hypothetical protein
LLGYKDCRRRSSHAEAVAVDEARVDVLLDEEEGAPEEGALPELHTQQQEVAQVTVVEKALFEGTPKQKVKAQRHRMLKAQIDETDVHEEQVALVSEMVSIARELTEEINPGFMGG